MTGGGVVFGGGGAKSLAHAGAWKALLEAGLRPFHIVCTSMGAVVGAAFAGGSSYERFDQLALPLTVTATDIDSGELMLFGALGGDAPLRDALYASCALPLYFPPGAVDGHRLADGGLRSVLPLEVARRVPADLIVAIDVGPGFDEPARPSSTALARLRPPPLIRAHGEAIRIMMAAQTERAIADWPKDGPRLVLVRPVAEREATFAVGEGERYLEAGYRETKRALG